jgi:hypothetical protein
VPTVGLLSPLSQEANQPTNNQAFYSHASWGRLEMKPHEKKTRTKQARKRRGETKGDKNQIKKRKCNKMLSQKHKKGWNFF